MQFKVNLRILKEWKAGLGSLPGKGAFSLLHINKHAGSPTYKSGRQRVGKTGSNYAPCSPLSDDSL